MNFSASVTLPSGEAVTIELGDQTDWSLQVTPVTDGAIARAYTAGQVFSNHISQGE